MKAKFTPLLVLLFSIISLYSCKNRSNLYEITDEFVESLSTTYESYGILGGQEHLKLTEDGKYQIFPSGRLINVKIMEVVDDDTYEELRKDLESHYEDEKRVNRVYRCQAGTIMIDCRN